MPRRRWIETATTQHPYRVKERTGLIISDVAKHRAYGLEKALIREDGIVDIFLPQKQRQEFEGRAKGIRMQFNDIRQCPGAHNSTGVAMWLKSSYYDPNGKTLPSDASAAILAEMDALCYALSVRTNNWIMDPEQPGKKLPGIKYEFASYNMGSVDTAEIAPTFMVLYTESKLHQPDFMKRISHELLINPLHVENESQRGIQGKLRRLGIEYRPQNGGSADRGF